MKCLEIAEKMLDFNLTRDNVPDVSGLRALLTHVAALVAIATDAEGEFHSRQAIAVAIALHQRDQGFMLQIERMQKQIDDLKSELETFGTGEGPWNP